MQRNLRRVGLVLLILVPFSLPGVRAAETGTLQGTLDKPATVTAVTAVDRETDKKYPAKLDLQTGKFVIEGVPLGSRVDCLIDFAGGRLEGVNLTVPRSDFEEEQPLSKEDRETLDKTARSLSKFEDVIEVLAIEGNIQHAAVLLNKLRTKPFYDSKPGEVVWRLELWHFEKPEETWVKVQDELFLVMYRQRLQKKDYDQKSLTLDPVLGGVRLTKEKPTADLGTVRLPDNKPGIRLRTGKNN